MTGRWFDRTFARADGALLPNLIERLRGAPARLEERLRGLAAADAVRAPDGGWSVQTHAGHLGDLEPLWLGRLDDFAAGREALRPADLENRKTHDAGHDRAPLAQVLATFRAQRAELVRRFEALTAAGRTATALHPRLRAPMTPADLAQFVAEHDDHHLARITALLRSAPAPAPDTRSLFLVIERFRPGKVAEVYRRFAERGRMAPDGVRYVDSWIDLPIARCFQVMEAEHIGQLHEWAARWDDLVEFEIVPVQTSAAAAAAMARRGAGTGDSDSDSDSENA
ncbi:MAG: DinB family protein [Planctomycetota bacterium]